MTRVVLLVTLLAAACATGPAYDAATGVPATLARDLVTAEHTVVVHAPIEDVWAYVSDSRRAVDWSVYFHHISPSSGVDGTLGARRRCFRGADERGVRWDELVLAVDAPRLRKMLVYDIHDVPGMTASRYLVWQVLEPISPTTTSLTFRTAIDPQRDALEKAEFLASTTEIERVFTLNLENIAAAVEGRGRLHAYEAP